MNARRIVGKVLAGIGLRRAFTLVEMLVVIAIIGILAGLILPALSSAREQSRRTNCLSNLDQIGKSLAIYCNNSNDYLPSYPGYGLPQSGIGRYYSASNRYSLYNYTGHQGPSRHMMIGYSAEFDPTDATPDLVAGETNFMPIGLGIMVDRGTLADPRVLDCPSMRQEVRTWYGAAEYRYDPGVWRKLGGQAGKNLVTGDGSALFQTATSGANRVVGILSSYAYRSTPFYCRTEPANAGAYPGAPPADWSAADEGYFSNLATGGRWLAEWDIPVPENASKTIVRAQFMTPPFKTRKQLKDRAFCADSFDYAAGNAQFGNGNGLVRNHHRAGYNAVYGDGHAAWYEDGNDVIRNWTHWADDSHLDTDNLTISSLSSNRVWNLFDRAAGLDMP